MIKTYHRVVNVARMLSVFFVLSLGIELCKDCMEFSLVAYPNCR